MHPTGHSVQGGGVVVASQHVLQISRPTPGGCVSQHALMQHHPCRRLLLWAVHMLLECILVCPTFALSSMDYIGKNEMIRRKQNKQECIPVGCVPRPYLVVSGGGHVWHACPLQCTPPCHAHPPMHNLRKLRLRAVKITVNKYHH